MAAIANACDLEVPTNGLLFPPCGMDDLANIFKTIRIWWFVRKEWTS